MNALDVFAAVSDVCEVLTLVLLVVTFKGLCPLWAAMRKHYEAPEAPVEEPPVTVHEGPDGQANYTFPVAELTSDDNLYDIPQPKAGRSWEPWK